MIGPLIVCVCGSHTWTEPHCLGLVYGFPCNYFEGEIILKLFTAPKAIDKLVPMQAWPTTPCGLGQCRAHAYACASIAVALRVVRVPAPVCLRACDASELLGKLLFAVHACFHLFGHCLQLVNLEYWFENFAKHRKKNSQQIKLLIETLIHDNEIGKSKTSITISIPW